MAATISRWRVYRRLLVCACAVLVVVAIAKLYATSVSSADEDGALAFVRLNGSTEHHVSHNALSLIASRFATGSTQNSWLAERSFSVSFPRDRMNDHMAEQLLAIRKLNAIYLYPAAHGGRIDFKANAMTLVNSLGELDLPVSPEYVRQLEDRFPKLKIAVIDRAKSEQSESETTLP